MQIIPKIISGHKYWYLIKKGRKDGVVTNTETTYLGKPERVARLLTDRAEDLGKGGFPIGFRSREMGASAALWKEAEALSLVELIDEVCGPRRIDAVISFGQLLVAAAIQRAVAPRGLKSCRKLKEWYKGCGVSDLLEMDATGLDTRRTHEAFSQLNASRIEQMELEIVKKMLQVHDISTDVLAFDATNFDSYAASATTSHLLRRGNAKSKRKNLRILGLGLLVTADDGLPLLSFVYPGNRADVTSFKSFLRRYSQRQKILGIGADATIVCDGGNVSKEVISRLEQARFEYVTRLPTGHAPEIDALETEDLKWLQGKLSGKVRAKKLRAKVYGEKRTAVAVYSTSMHESQMPGLLRDIHKAKKDLEALRKRLDRQREGKGRGKSLTIATARQKAEGCLQRQHMASLFRIEIDGSDAAPVLKYSFDEEAWKKIQKNRLGRTAILTSRKKWSAQKNVETLRGQSHVEEAFKFMKDPDWISATPLMHFRDAMLRIHAFISVLGLLLAKLVLRRLNKGGVEMSMNDALRQLADLKMARLRYGPEAPPLLKAIARTEEVPPDPTPQQRAMIRVLKLKKILKLPPTRA
jgi:transposase